MKHFTRSILFATTALCSTTLYAEDVSKYTFTFSPPDNTKFVQKLTITKEKDMGELGRVVDQSVSTVNIVVKKNDAGWDISAKPEEIEITHNGQVVNNPMMDLAFKMGYVYKLKEDGHIVDISGLEEFVEGLREEMEDPIAKQLANILNVDVIKAKEFSEWNGRIGSYLGTQVKVGDLFQGKVPYKLPNGSVINYAIYTKIAGVEKCPAGECLRVEQTYDSQVDNSTGRPLLENTHSSGDLDSPSLPAADMDSVSGMVSRLIDPATMLIYDEFNQRVLKMSVEVPGQGVKPLVTSETRNYEFIY